MNTHNVNTVTNQLITNDASVFLLVVSVCSLVHASAAAANATFNVGL